MVLNVEVQASEKPRFYRAMPVEVECYLCLMHGPGVLHPACVPVGQREVRLLDSMGQLEDGAQRRTHGEHHHRVVEERNPQGMIDDRNHKSQGAKDQLASDKGNKVPALRPRHSVPVYPTGHEVNEITDQLHLDHQESVKNPQVKVLPAMKPEPFLVRRKPAGRAYVDVRIPARYVHIVVMYKGVLPMPDIGTDPNQVHGHRCQSVDPAVLRESPMAAVMLDAEPDSGCGGCKE